VAPAAYCLECLYVAPRSLLTSSTVQQLARHATPYTVNGLGAKEEKKKETDEEQEEERDGFQRAPCRRLVNSLSLLLSSRQQRQQ